MKNQILRLAFVICAMSMLTYANAQKLSKKAEETVKKEVAEMSEVVLVPPLLQGMRGLVLRRIAG